jgi:hypothetical protein
LVCKRTHTIDEIHCLNNSIPTSVPLLPLIAWGGYSALGYNVFEKNASAYIPSTSYKAINVNEQRNGRNDVGDVYIFEYSDGTKEVKYTKTF